MAFVAADTDRGLVGLAFLSFGLKSLKEWGISMFKKILIVVVVVVIVIAAFLVVASFQPDNFRIARATTIAATPADVFAHVNDFHKWEEWSPWAKLDPTMKASYEGTNAGEGSSYAWTSEDNKVGEGRMTITQVKAPETILISLQFVRPMKGDNVTEFRFEPQGSGTQVSWIMTGKNNLIAKAIHMLLDIDKMVGRDFDKGLAQLKQVSEKK